MAADMKAQIDEHNKYIDAREGQANHSILTNFKKGLLVQINMQEPFSVADATMLIGAIKTSRFPVDIQNELEEAVECKTKTAAASAAKGESSGNKKQMLKPIWNYPTSEDWDALLDPKKSWSTKACVLLHRLNLVGLNNASTQTEKWILALLLMVSYTEIPGPQCRFEKLIELKNLIKTEKKTFDDLPHLVVYPDKPSELPLALLEHGYPNGEVAVAKDLPGITAIGGSIPLRKISKMLKSRDHDKLKEQFDSLKGSLQADSAGSSAMPGGSSGSSKDWHVLINQSDPEEVQALANFHKELQQIRALKSGGHLILNSPAPGVAEEPPKPTTLVLGTCPSSGKWAIQPKAEIKQEVVDSAVEAEDKGDHATIDSDSDALDDVSKASLKAMEKKLACKKKQAASKRAANKAAVKKQKHEAAATIKARPSCATPASPAKKLKVEPIEVTKKGDMKTSMPSLTSDGKTIPILYKGGVIYGGGSCNSWRVLINKDRLQEKRVAWGAPHPTQDSWEKAYKLLDDASA